MPQNHDSRDPRDRDPHQRGSQPPVPDTFIPEGRWPVIAVQHSFGDGKSAEQIGVLLQFLEGPGKGQTRTWYGSWSEAAIEFTLDALRALGWKGDDLRDLSTIYPKTGGKAAIAVLQHEFFDGKWREKIAWINGDGVAMNKPLDGPAFEKFAARMRNLIPRVEGRAGSSAAPSGYGQQERPPVGQGGYYDNAGGRDARNAEPPPPSDRDAPPNRGRPW
jgi:hypothetical protein